MSDKRLPPKWLAYAAAALVILARVWAAPLVVIGWLAGTAWAALGVGWELALPPPLAQWSTDLLAARRRREHPPVTVVWDDGPEPDDWHLRDPDDSGDDLEDDE